MQGFSRKFIHFCKKHWPVWVLLLVVLLFFRKVFLGLIPFPGDFVVGIYYPWLDYKWGFEAGVPVKNPILADIPSFIFPMQTFAVELLKQGVWPLWNPYILGGTPLLANFQSAPFSPTAIFYFIFNVLDAWTIQIIAQHYLAALFTYILLRHWNASKIASVFGGIVYAFSGFNMIWSGWNGHALGASYIPLILYFEDKIINGRSKFSGLGLSIVFCLQIFSGYPQTVIYTAVASLLLWFLYCRKSTDFIYKTVKLGFYFLLGLGLSAIQLLPSMELLGLSQWTAEPHPFEWAFLPFVKTITFIAPDFFGNHATGNYWGPQDYTSNTGFSGVIAFMFAFYALLTWSKRKKYVNYSVILLIVTFILVYPTPISVFMWKHNLVGMRSSSAHRGLVLLNLAVSMLCAYGVDAYIKEGKKIKTFLAGLFTGIILGVYCLISFYLYKTNNNNIDYIVGMRNLVFPWGILVLSLLVLFITKKLKKFNLFGIFIVFVLAIFELFRFGWKFTSFAPRNFIFPTTPVIEFLKNQKPPFRVSLGDSIPVNLHMSYGLETLGGYETMRPEKASRFIAALNNNSKNANPAGRYGIIDNDTSPLLALANTKYYLALKKNSQGEPDPEGELPERFSSERFNPVFEDKSVVVFEAIDALPRAYMVYDWQITKGLDAFDVLFSRDFEMGKQAVIEKHPPIQPGKDTNYHVDFREYGPQNSVIAIDTNSPGILVISNANYPGWRAKLDGADVEIFDANYVFQGVAVPEGRHILSLYYYPESFKYAIFLSIFSGFFVLTTLIRSAILVWNER